MDCSEEELRSWKERIVSCQTCLLNLRMSILKLQKNLLHLVNDNQCQNFELLTTSSENLSDHIPTVNGVHDTNETSSISESFTSSDEILTNGKKDSTTNLSQKMGFSEVFLRLATMTNELVAILINILKGFTDSTKDGKFLMTVEQTMKVLREIQNKSLDLLETAATVFSECEFTSSAQCLVYIIQQNLDSVTSMLQAVLNWMSAKLDELCSFEIQGKEIAKFLLEKILYLNRISEIPSDGDLKTEVFNYSQLKDEVNGFRHKCIEKFFWDGKSISQLSNVDIKRFFENIGRDIHEKNAELEVLLNQRLERLNHVINDNRNDLVIKRDALQNAIDDPEGVQWLSLGQIIEEEKKQKIVLMELATLKQKANELVFIEMRLKGGSSNWIDVTKYLAETIRNNDNFYFVHDSLQDKMNVLKSIKEQYRSLEKGWLTLKSIETRLESQNVNLIFTSESLETLRTDLYTLENIEDELKHTRSKTTIRNELQKSLEECEKVKLQIRNEVKKAEKIQLQVNTCNLTMEQTVKNFKSIKEDIASSIDIPSPNGEKLILYSSFESRLKRWAKDLIKVDEEIRKLNNCSIEEVIDSNQLNKMKNEHKILWSILIKMRNAESNIVAGQSNLKDTIMTKIRILLLNLKEIHKEFKVPLDIKAVQQLFEDHKIRQCHISEQIRFVEDLCSGSLLGKRRDDGLHLLKDLKECFDKVLKSRDEHLEKMLSLQEAFGLNTLKNLLQNNNRRLERMKTDTIFEFDNELKNKDLKDSQLSLQMIRGALSLNKEIYEKLLSSSNEEQKKILVTEWQTIKGLTEKATKETRMIRRKLRRIYRTWNKFNRGIKSISENLRMFPLKFGENVDSKTELFTAAHQLECNLSLLKQTEKAINLLKDQAAVLKAHAKEASQKRICTKIENVDRQYKVKKLEMECKLSQLSTVHKQWEIYETSYSILVDNLNEMTLERDKLMQINQPYAESFQELQQKNGVLEKSIDELNTLASDVQHYLFIFGPRNSIAAERLSNEISHLKQKNKEFKTSIEDHLKLMMAVFGKKRLLRSRIDILNELLARIGSLGKSVDLVPGSCNGLLEQHDRLVRKLENSFVFTESLISKVKDKFGVSLVMNFQAEFEDFSRLKNMSPFLTQQQKDEICQLLELKKKFLYTKDKLDNWCQLTEASISGLRSCTDFQTYRILHDLKLDITAKEEFVLELETLCSKISHYVEEVKIEGSKKQINALSKKMKFISCTVKLLLTNSGSWVEFDESLRNMHQRLKTLSSQEKQTTREFLATVITYLNCQLLMVDDHKNAIREISKKTLRLDQEEEQPSREIILKETQSINENFELLLYPSENQIYQLMETLRKWQSCAQESILPLQLVSTEENEISMKMSTSLEKLPKSTKNCGQSTITFFLLAMVAIFIAIVFSYSNVQEIITVHRNGVPPV